jgi:hypothetical protein
MPPTLDAPVYIIGPISLRPDGNRPAFTEAAHRLRLLTYRVLNPRELPGSDECAAEAVRLGPDYRHGPMYQKALRECLAWLLEAKSAVALPEWYKSEGASWEVLTCERLGIPVFDSEHLLPLGTQFPPGWQHEGAATIVENIRW